MFICLIMLLLVRTTPFWTIISVLLFPHFPNSVYYSTKALRDESFRLAAAHFRLIREQQIYKTHHLSGLCTFSRFQRFQYSFPIQNSKINCFQIMATFRDILPRWALLWNSFKWTHFESWVSQRDWYSPRHETSSTLTSFWITTAFWRSISSEWYTQYSIEKVLLIHSCFQCSSNRCFPSWIHWLIFEENAENNSALDQLRSSPIFIDADISYVNFGTFSEIDG